MQAIASSMPLIPSTEEGTSFPHFILFNFLKTHSRLKSAVEHLLITVEVINQMIRQVIPPKSSAVASVTFMNVTALGTGSPCLLFLTCSSYVLQRHHGCPSVSRGKDTFSCPVKWKRRKQRAMCIFTVKWEKCLYLFLLPFVGFSLVFIKSVTKKMYLLVFSLQGINRHCK